MTSPVGSVSTSLYDAAGRLKAAINPLGSRMTYSYDALGRQTAIIDPLLHRTTAVYDAMGRVRVTIDGLAQRTTNVYDAVGRQTGLVNARNNRHTLVYDAAGRLSRQTDPLLRHTTYTYDASSRRKSRLDPRLVRTTYLYDTAGRLTGRRNSLDAPVTFVYDAVANRTRMSDATGRTTYTYCCPGQVLTVTNPAGKRISYSYDAAERRSRMIDPDGGRFTYSYDAASRIQRLINPQGERTTWSYDAAGRPRDQKLANGTRTSWTHDAAGQVWELAHLKSDNSYLSALNYSYDGAGNRTRVQLLLSSVRTTWTYDNANRLTVENKGGSGAYRMTHVYDAVGNRLVKADGALRTTFAYDAANQLQTAKDAGGTTTYTFDSAGNQLRARTSTAIVTHAWDGENHLTRYYRTDAPALVTHTYDGDGQRVKYEQNVTGETKKLIWDGQNVLAETNAANATQVVYTLEPRLYGHLVSQRRGGSTYYYHHDALGSTERTTDASQATANTYAYEAYGQTSVSSKPVITNPFKFVGRLGYYHDFIPGQYAHVRARCYDPVTARWFSQDPIGPLFGPNQYAYVRCTPIAHSDPTGRQGAAILFVPVVANIRSDFSHCGRDSVNVRTAVKFVIDWNLVDFGDTGWVIQEIEYKVTVFRCKGGVDVTSAVLPNYPAQDHFWEAFDIQGIHMRKAIAEPDDEFKLIVEDFAPYSLYGYYDIKGKVMGVSKANLTSDFVSNSVPSAGPMPATRQKPANWDQLAKASHELHITWDCCCRSVGSFRSIPESDPNSLNKPSPGTPWPDNDFDV